MFSTFNNRATQKELMDELDLSGEALRQNLDELELINERLGGNAVVLTALQSLYRAGAFAENRIYTFADIGTGGGDVLRSVAKWCKKRRIEADLCGIDANDFMIDYATQKAVDFPNIRFQKDNVFDDTFAQKKYDFVLCSLFCHHFTNHELSILLIRFFDMSRCALIINDLHRHFLAYYGIKILTWLFRGSYLVKHDAPLSVWRAFRRHEIIQLLQQANVKNHQIRWQWAFRWRIVCKKLE